MKKRLEVENRCIKGKRRTHPSVVIRASSEAIAPTASTASGRVISLIYQAREHEKQAAEVSMSMLNNKRTTALGNMVAKPDLNLGKGDGTGLMEREPAARNVPPLTFHLLDRTYSTVRTVQHHYFRRSCFMKMAQDKSQLDIHTPMHHASSSQPTSTDRVCTEPLAEIT